MVEDDRNFGAVLRSYLNIHDYDVDWVDDGAAALETFGSGEYDLCILDVMLPNVDGFSIAENIRSLNEGIPIIFLTAKTLKKDILEGFRLGADDYITKPFEIKELKARIRAVLRRVEGPPADQSSSLSLDEGRLVVDLSSPTVIRQGVEVSLTPIEYKLFLFLARNAGRVLTYEQILQHVWGPGYENSLGNVKVYVRRLRKKIEADPSQPRYIQTRWGVGYYLSGQVDSTPKTRGGQNG